MTIKNIRCFTNVFLEMIALAAALQLSCQDPAKTPDTGMFLPTDRRSSPQALLDQLIESYESKRLDLFIDLLPVDSSFQFFIAPGYYEEYRTRHQPMSQVRDTSLFYIGETEYYFYWPQKVEIDNHTLMFKNAFEIDFVDKPGLESVRRFVVGGDSLAEMLVTGGKFYLNVSRGNGDTIEQYPVSIEKQVLVIQLDPDHRWVIKKWYDFSSEM